MVFGFLRKPSFVKPEKDPLPSSPGQSSAQLHGTSAEGQDAPVQLRTPSPSVASANIAAGPPRSPSPSSRISHLSVDGHRKQSNSPIRPSAAVNATDATPAPEAEPTVQSLTTRVAAIPAKVLHSYILTCLPSTPETSIPVLHAFFADLAPPPRLHCVRCHKDYVEVENDDRACLVAHDDESAEVERVGRVVGRKPGDPGSTYETLWGCCGKTVEGDGDQGPPDGWCYEGKHTTDIKRARFRADSTSQDDKLVSCLRLNCHGVRDQMPRASLRKRQRSAKNLKEPDTDEDASEGEEDSGMEEITGRRKPAKFDQMDVDQDEPESASRAGSARGKPKATAVPSGKRRGRPPKAKALQDAETQDHSDAPSVQSAPKKRRGRPPKSKAIVEDSDAEPDAPGSEPARGQHRTRSQSRSRAAAKKPESSTGAASGKVRGAKKGKAAEEAAEEQEDDQPKKKRKTTS